MHVLITGGAGFIGSNLARVLAGKNIPVVVVDNLLTGRRENLKDVRCVFVESDVNDKLQVAALSSRYKFTHVFHFAAVVGVQRTLADPIAVLRDIDGFKNIFELAVQQKIQRVLFASSSEVYGEPVSHPQVEGETPLNSRLPYAVVKNIGECFARSYFLKYGLKFTILRFFNTIGVNQSEDFVLSNFLANAIRNQPLVVNGSGAQTRTFCHVSDTVETCLKSLYTEEAINEVINVGSDEEVRIIDLASDIIQRLGSSSRILHAPALKEGDMKRRCPDITKMKRILGRQPLAYSDLLNKVIDEKRGVLHLGGS